MSAAIAACGSSTGPSSPSAAQRASYVDSVMLANCTGPANVPCGLSMTVLNVMWAGAIPSRIQVVTPSGPAHWWAIVAASYQAVGTQGRVDTAEHIVVFTDSTFTSGIDIQVYNDSGPSFGGGQTYLDSRQYGGAIVSGSTRVARVGTGCVAVPNLSIQAPYPTSNCRYAQFAISFSFNLGLAGTAAVQNINGILIGP